MRNEFCSYYNFWQGVSCPRHALPNQTHLIYSCKYSVSKWQICIAADTVFMFAMPLQRLSFLPVSTADAPHRSQSHILNNMNCLMQAFLYLRQLLSAYEEYIFILLHKYLFFLDLKYFIPNV